MRLSVYSLACVLVAGACVPAVELSSDHGPTGVVSLVFDDTEDGYADVVERAEEICKVRKLHAVEVGRPVKDKTGRSVANFACVPLP
jgi:hypothetical protein